MRLQTTETPVQVQVLDRHIDRQLVATAMGEMRQFVASQLKEDVHYAKRGGAAKPTLEKPGAEVIFKGFLARPQFTVLYREHNSETQYAYFEVLCEAVDIHTGIITSQGVGSSDTGRDSGNQGFAWKANTALKMAKKSAMIDCAVTLGCVSEFFTQDMQGITEEDVSMGNCPKHGVPFLRRVGTAKGSGRPYDFWACPKKDGTAYCKEKPQHPAVTVEDPFYPAGAEAAAPAEAQ